MHSQPSSPATLASCLTQAWLSSSYLWGLEVPREQLDSSNLLHPPPPPEESTSLLSCKSSLCILRELRL